MSTYEAKDSKTRAQQLKVQEVAIHATDVEMVEVDGSDLIVKVGEKVTKVVMVVQKVDATPTLTVIPAADLSIVDSVAHTAGGDAKAIKVTGCTLATNDVLLVKYETKQ